MPTLWHKRTRKGHQQKAVALTEIMMNRFTDSVCTLRSIVAVFEQRGLDPEGIMAAAGCGRESMEDPHTRLSIEQIEAGWRVASLESGDPCLGLHAAEQVQYGSLGSIDFICEASPTVGGALQRLCWYYPLLNNCVILAAAKGRRDCALYLGSHIGKLYPSMIDFILATTVIHTRHFWQIDWNPLRVEFPYPQPQCLKEYERIFRCSLSFDAPIARLSLPRELWESPLSAANPALLRLLEEQAVTQLTLQPPPRDTEARIRTLIGSKLFEGTPCLEAVAREMGYSPRNLQRQLKAIDRSFGQILDNVRAQTARYYLRDPEIPVWEIANILGFAEASSFTRAFKRWTGRSPMQYRKQFN